MSFSTEMKDDIFVVKVDNPRAIGRFAGELKKELQQQIAKKGHTKGVVDLTDVEFMDSSLLGTLVLGLKWSTFKEGDLKIVGLQPPVQAMFELTRMYKIFDVYDNVEEALAAF